MKYLFLALLIATANGALADDVSAVETKLKAAMEADVRSDADKARDDNRLPIETLQFFGLREDMKIVELIPGGGWYTKLLVPVVRDKGEFYAALGTSRIADSLMAETGFDQIKITAAESKVYRKEDSRLYTLETEGFGVTNADMVLTFRNYHNFDAAGRAAMNKGAYEALKAGGIYAVVDHTRRHMEADNSENRRRFDPVQAIMEIQAAGFTLVDYAQFHARADDELRYEVGRKSVTGNTDRWTLKFVK